MLWVETPKIELMRRAGDKGVKAGGIGRHAFLPDLRDGDLENLRE